MKLELHCQGSYGAGLFPHTAEGMQNLLRAGVYLRIKSNLLGLVEYLLMQRLGVVGGESDGENINRSPVAEFDTEVVVENECGALATACKIGA